MDRYEGPQASNENDVILNQLHMEYGFPQGRLELVLL